LIVLTALDGLNTHPNHQRKGAASSMLKWGTELADKNKLKICLEGTPAGVPLYMSHGFKPLETVVHHLKEYGGPEEYSYVLMVRDPAV
jgi:GNAT superfamily N-acetyltransferase